MAEGFPSFCAAVNMSHFVLSNETLMRYRLAYDESIVFMFPEFVSQSDG